MDDYQAAIGAFAMGPNTNYIVHSIDGFGLPDVRATDTPRPRQHGEFFGQDYLAGRTLTVTLTVRGASPAEVVANVDALMAVWQPISVDAATVDAFMFQFPGQSARVVYGRPRRAVPDMSRIIGNNAPCVLEFHCADPRQYAATGVTGSLGIFVASTGRSYPRTYPLAFGSGVSDIYSAINAGNFATRPTAHITGPVTNPRIENVTAGQFIKVGVVLSATDFLDIDFDARTIVLNGTTSRRSALTYDSTWWELPPGTSSIKFSADTFDVGSTLTLTYASAWL